MERKVIGAGMMFLGSGCGPALTDDHKQLLKSIQPDQFYPLDDLLEIFRNAQKTNPELIYATGRRWGNAIKDDMLKRGATTIKSTLNLIASVYQEHHKGDVGELVVEDDGDQAIVLTNRGPYPTMLIVGAYEAIITALGGEDVALKKMKDENQYRLSWVNGD